MLEYGVYLLPSQFEAGFLLNARPMAGSTLPPARQTVPGQGHGGFNF